jgi:hypothetical protein
MAVFYMITTRVWLLIALRFRRSHPDGRPRKQEAAR